MGQFSIVRCLAMSVFSFIQIFIMRIKISLVILIGYLTDASMGYTQKKIVESKCLYDGIISDLSIIIYSN